MKCLDLIYHLSSFGSKSTRQDLVKKTTPRHQQRLRPMGDPQHQVDGKGREAAAPLPARPLMSGVFGSAPGRGTEGARATTPPPPKARRYWKELVNETQYPRIRFTNPRGRKRSV